MKSLEEIAREAAERAVAVEFDQPNRRWRVAARGGPGLLRWDVAPEELARGQALLLADFFRGLILAALREAVSQVPGEPPMSQDKLDLLRLLCEDRSTPWEDGAADAALASALKLIDHQSRLIAFLSNETDGGYARGYDEGRASVAGRALSAASSAYQSVSAISQGVGEAAARPAMDAAATVLRAVERAVKGDV